MVNLSVYRQAVCVVAALFAGSATSYGQRSPGPQPVPEPKSISVPADTPYPGTIDLQIDLTDLQRKIVGVHETIPVKAGALTLLYPKWIPGNHSPTGPISRLGGLTIGGNGTKIEWTRDRIDMYAFHIQVPSGVAALQVDFQFLAPVRSSDGRISISSKMADLAWNTVVLYPAGHFARRIAISPTVKLPEHWQFACALEAGPLENNVVHFKETTLNTLIDSPLYAGVNFSRVDLSSDSGNRVFLDVVADTPANLAITPEELDLHRRMVSQAAKLYGSHHYDHYDFLFLLSDTVGGIGLEHHQSSEDGTYANYFTDWPSGVIERDLLAHEYTHSWNGKFRRPADLWTPNFNVPMQNDLLWVYEGLTQYFGYVLTARSGLRTADQTRDLIALIAANFDASPGRTWRSLVDTTNQPIVSQRAPVSWISWQRPEDYYMEGLLIWLDVDTRIREMSSGKKSLDDFAKLFFGIDNGSYVTRTYTLEDVVSALSTVQKFDWSTYLRSRVYAIAPQTPKDGITRGGYRLTYSDTPPEWLKKTERPDYSISFATSLGFSIKNDGELDRVWWDSPAFKAGIVPGMQLLAVNGTTFKMDVLRSAIKDAGKDPASIKLLLKNGDQVQTIEVNYHEGLRYPKLERVEGTPALLDQILTPAA